MWSESCHLLSYMHNNRSELASTAVNIKHTWLGNEYWPYSKHVALQLTSPNYAFMVY